LQREEIPLIWQIDRREIVENIYHLREGRLILEPEYFDIQGWPPGEAELYTPILVDCHDRGGTFWGAFEHNLLVGAAILETRFIGARHDTLQLKFLHVSRDYRKHGLGRALFQMAVEKARSLGAKKLYISARLPKTRSIPMPGLDVFWQRRPTRNYLPWNLKISISNM
jgi:predicted N-acetyltransferase YhbS